MRTAAMEDHLKTIYHLGRTAEGPVRTSAIAEAVERTPATVSSMLDRLVEEDLCEREKYRGCRLTPEGERAAIEVIRHHRLLETFLCEVLAFEPSVVHAEADRLEHHISERLEAELAARLEDPSVDPHGHPIPSAELEPPVARQTGTLGMVTEGARVEVVHIADRDPAVVQFLTDAAIRPGAMVTVQAIEPTGVRQVLTDVTETAVPADIAAEIAVTEGA
ncbi:MAG: metal-dependent transcriptional regulator [Haloquadratum sp.]|jgi:Mn-dependent transcriptional regulator|nr:metal-dependent transcriptional regulator [Haloferacaceae archaeon]MDR9444916.1 metal-dependent transcriptional regulator [Haloquadratum sp.]